MMKMGLPVTAICLTLMAVIGMSSAAARPGHSDLCRNRICTFEYDPVCGSDGVTYSNPCGFNLEKRCTNPRLTIRCRGSCSECHRN